VSIFCMDSILTWVCMICFMRFLSSWNVHHPSHHISHFITVRIIGCSFAMNDIHLFSEGITICEESFGRMRANQSDLWHISTSTDPNFLFAIFTSGVEMMKNGGLPCINLYENIFMRSDSETSVAVKISNQSVRTFSDF
jgi:hypothetical protein